MTHETKDPVAQDQSTAARNLGRNPEDVARVAGIESRQDHQFDVAAEAKPLPQDLLKEADDWTNHFSMPLFNPTKPAYILKHERPEHRIILFLKAQGLNHIEIAERIGWSAAGVSNVVRQPWAQALIVKEIEKSGRDAVNTLLDAEDVNSLCKLIQIRDDVDAPIAEQRKAANDLLDRKYGKPTQPILSAELDPRTLSDVQLAQIAKKALPN